VAGLQPDCASLVNDNDELLSRARLLLVRMCGVTPPRHLIGPILSAIFDTILNSPVRLSRVSFEILLTLFVVMEGPNAGPAFGARFVWPGFVLTRKSNLSPVFYFRQVPLLSDARITEILEVRLKKPSRYSTPLTLARCFANVSMTRWLRSAKWPLRTFSAIPMYLSHCVLEPYLESSVFPHAVAN
jgi:hypothetical protein